MEAIKVIIQNEILSKNGIMIFETDRDDSYINSANNFAKIIDSRKYGRVKLIFLCRKE